MDLFKYPRTPHLVGSGVQRGDEDMYVIPLRELEGRYLVIEEKMDGANCALRFDENGQLFLQSRGHFLTGGPRERQFHLFKQWSYRYMQELYEVLEDRYILFGEWLYAKHTVFYTELPHYFLEFDIYDTARSIFLSTEQRRKLLRSLPFIVSVKVLTEGIYEELPPLPELIGPSHFIGAGVLERLQELCISRGLEFERVLEETDTSGLMEGLYIKVEEEGVVKERYKYVRAGFLQSLLSSGSHWMERPILPNQLRADVSLFGGDDNV